MTNQVAFFFDDAIDVEDSNCDANFFLDPFDDDEDCSCRSDDSPVDVHGFPSSRRHQSSRAIDTQKNSRSEQQQPICSEDCDSLLDFESVSFTPIATKGKKNSRSTMKQNRDGRRTSAAVVVQQRHHHHHHDERRRTVAVVGGKRNRLPRKSKSLDSDAKVAFAAAGAASGNATASNRKTTNRLPRKSKSDGSADRAAVVARAVAAQRLLQQSTTTPAATETTERPSRSRRSISIAKREEAAASTAGAFSNATTKNKEEMATLRRSRTSSSAGRRTTATSSTFDGNEKREQVLENRSARRSNRRNTVVTGGVGNGAGESAQDRADRLKELGLAFKAASLLEKTVVPQTNHLTKDIML